MESGIGFMDEGRKERVTIKSDNKEYVLLFRGIICTALSIIITMIYINYMNYALEENLIEFGRWRGVTIYLSGMFIFACAFLMINVLTCSIKLKLVRGGSYLIGVRFP